MCRKNRLVTTDNRECTWYVQLMTTPPDGSLLKWNLFDQTENSAAPGIRHGGVFQEEYYRTLKSRSAYDGNGQYFFEVTVSASSQTRRRSAILAMTTSRM